ncbi:putative quinone oxidoreductase, YhdH/YhfP family [Hoeflea sp. IMCC20628]|uniref:acrylyl-CoA reductase (NADPH) n=1 Tax=Hoeflea sp. IMCC20628 TaxID=1620421 RepID=UPI00063B0131|nr:MDR family oxidoreductase [Hoeflea sp. IMCC20628]AKI02477.1 putative quinone oxidoreductase, YhdH/YhfP family [Hoeflea sp. IMCC20628]
MQDRFKGILLTRDENKVMSVNVTELGLDDLMDGDVVVEVEWTTVNYKDGLAITGKGPVVRRWPMIPGIDCAGTVVSSENERFNPGDKVILNGFGVGEVHTGAYATYARLKGDWLIPMPEGMDGRSAMAIGTAGYTAMLSVMALERHGITPGRGPVVVTGANGGVGTVAIAVLGKLGYEVIASTGRTDEADFLKSLGASEVIHRDELSGPAKPLAKERWIGAVDAVGSHTLANVLSMTSYGGAVTACGLAQGMDLPGSVAPFILRGVSLLGIDSVMAPLALRQEAWSRLVKDLDIAKLEALSTEIGFDGIVDAAHSIIDGKVRGRVVVNMKQ